MLVHYIGLDRKIGEFHKMNTALVLAGGTGTRLGADIPKQYIEVNGRMIIDYCLRTLNESDYIDAIWIVAEPVWQDKIKVPEKFIGFSRPGKNRQLSIYNGLKDIQEYILSAPIYNDNKNIYKNKVAAKTEISSTINTVLIHDAARPLLKEDTIRLCMEAIYKDGYDGAMPVLPMKDTIYVSNDGRKVDSLIDRATVYAGQAPELFMLDKYIDANIALFPDRILSINGSSEPAVMAGMNIALIQGDEGNYKITTKADLERFIADN